MNNTTPTMKYWTKTILQWLKIETQMKCEHHNRKTKSETPNAQRKTTRTEIILKGNSEYKGNIKISSSI